MVLTPRHLRRGLGLGLGREPFTAAGQGMPYGGIHCRTQRRAAKEASKQGYVPGTSPPLTAQRAKICPVRASGSRRQFTTATRDSAGE